MSSPAAAPAPADIIKSRGYLVLLVSGAIVGIPAAAVVYFFWVRLVSSD